MNLGISEKQALALTQADNMNTFEQKQAANALGFPLFIHARITRNTRSPGSKASSPDVGSSQTDVASSQTDDKTAEKAYVSYVLEDFDVASWTPKETPNASYQPVVNVLNNLPNHEENIIFCYVQDLKPDPHYGFKVMVDAVEAPPAAFAAVLIESFRPSVTTACGDGFKITTEGITDAADPQETDNATQQSFVVVGYGPLDDMVRLDPPRGKKIALLCFSSTRWKTTHCSCKKLNISSHLM